MAVVLTLPIIRLDLQKLFCGFELCIERICRWVTSIDECRFLWEVSDLVGAWN